MVELSASELANLDKCIQKHRDLIRLESYFRGQPEAETVMKLNKAIQEKLRREELIR